MRITENMVMFFTWRDVCSNWHTSPFMDTEGNHFQNNEQYIMFRKAVMFGDVRISRLILNEIRPKEVKALGRLVKDFDPVVWDARKMLVMCDGLLLKAKYHQPFRDILKRYGATHSFVEASPYDKIWGCGLGMYDKGVEDRANWTGKNLLGIAMDAVAETILAVDE